MKEEELFKNALNFYLQKGKELNAIEAFKILLNEYPENVKAWTHLSTMQNQITDFDGAIDSIDRAIQIEPDNSWIIRQKCTLLQGLISYPAEGQVYFNEQTKEAYKILSFKSKNELQIEFEKSVLKVIELERDNEKVHYDFKWKLAINYQRLEEHEQAIETLHSLKQHIPSNFNAKRKEKQLNRIENGITNSLIGLARYEEAIQRLEKESVHNSDPYFLGLRLYELYQKVGKTQKAEEVIQQVYKDNEHKISTQPEIAYLSRKFELLAIMRKPALMDDIFVNYELIKNQTEFTEKRLSEIKQKIKNYRQQED